MAPRMGEDEDECDIDQILSVNRNPRPGQPEPAPGMADEPPAESGLRGITIGEPDYDSLVSLKRGGAGETQRLVQAMKTLIAGSDPQLMPDREVAQFIVALHEERGEDALNSFVGRMTGSSKPAKLLPEEEQLMLKHCSNVRYQVEPKRFHCGLSRRLIPMSVIAGIGSTTLAAIMGARVMGVDIVNPVAKHVPGSTHVTAPLENQATTERRRDAESLIRYIKTYPDPTSPGDYMQMIKEVDNKLDQIYMHRPRVSPIELMLHTMAGIGGIVAAVYLYRKQKSLSLDIDNIYLDAARYIAHKATEIIKPEHGQAPAEKSAQGHSI